MAKSSRRGKTVEPEEEELSQAEGGANREETFLMGLLILAFGFILFGIGLNWYILYDRYDTPFFGFMAKEPGQTVKDKVYQGKAAPDGEDEEAGDDEGGDSGGSDDGGGGEDSE